MDKKSGMSGSEAYETMQAEFVRINDLKVGDSVKVLRGFEYNEGGCCAMDCSKGRSYAASRKYDAIVGQIREVGKISPRYIELHGTHNAPFFVLEKVESKKIEPAPNLSEAYQVMQANCGIEVGDTVEVVRVAEDDELGWDNSWPHTRIGKQYEVERIDRRAGVYLDGLGYPFYVLKLIKKASKIKWLTKEYIAEQAQISDLAALKCSLEHHKQGIEASVEELREAFEDKLFSTSNEHCALCSRFWGNGSCRGCPIKAANCTCCGPFATLVCVKDRLIYDKDTDKSAYNTAAQALCDRIQSEIDKLEAAEKKKVEVTYKPGDRFMVHKDERILVSSGNAGVGPGEMILVNPVSGTRWKAPITVKDRKHVTVAEMWEMGGWVKPIFIPKDKAVK